ncbi:uncharacterized protein C17orf78 homolog isoform X1 [Podarcis muralis]
MRGCEQPTVTRQGSWLRGIWTLDLTGLQLPSSMTTLVAVADGSRSLNNTWRGHRFPILDVHESENTSREALSRNHTVAALQCSGPQGTMQVHFIVSEKMYRGKLKAMDLFYGLKQITDPDERGCAAKCCLISADHRKSLQRQAEASIMGKVLLPGVSDCFIISNQTNNDNFARSLEKATEIRINATCQEADEMEDRKKIGVFLKIAVLCVMVPLMFFFMVFGVCEVPCPCSLPRWTQCLFPTQKHEAKEKKMTEATNPAAHGIPTMVCLFLTVQSCLFHSARRDFPGRRTRALRHQAHLVQHPALTMVQQVLQKEAYNLGLRAVALSPLVIPSSWYSVEVEHSHCG